MGGLNEVTEIMDVLLNRARTSILTSQEPFLLTNGVYGDGSNRIEMRNVSGDSVYSKLVGDEGCFEAWITPPLLSIPVNSIAGIFSTNSSNSLINLLFITYEFSSADAWSLQYRAYNSSGANLFNHKIRILRKNGASIKDNIHIVLSWSNISTTYNWNIYVNGVINGNYTSSTKPSSFNFNFCTDRGLSFSKTGIMATRWTDKSFTEQEVLDTYNGGNWTESIYPDQLIFDQRFDNRDGNDFIDNFNNALKFTAVNYIDVTNNVFTPSEITSPVLNIVFVGNSLTWGQSGSTNNGTYPNQLLGMIDSDSSGHLLRAINYGIDGQQTSGVISNYTNREEKYFDSTASKNIVIIWTGQNEIRLGSSGEDAYANIQTLMGLVANKPWDSVLLLTVLPSNSAAQFNARRAVLNPLIVNNAASLGATLVNVAADTTIGEDGDESNTTYYSDGLHLKNAGNAIVKNYVNNQLSL